MRNAKDSNILLIETDLHTRNLAFAITPIQSLDEAQCLQKLRKPETAPVKRKDGKELEPNVPLYLVRPSHYRLHYSLPLPPIRIIDFGESFFHAQPPTELHTPLVVRAPEAVFKDRLDFRVDLWSMGCTVKFSPSALSFPSPTISHGCYLWILF